jgi:hypothetical protein
VRGPEARSVAPVLAALATVALLTGIARAEQGSAAQTVTDISVPASLSNDAVGAPAPASSTLVQLNPCGGSSDQPQSATPTQTAGGTQVSFRIAPATIAQVDRNGAIIAVATNTGCAPQSWNQFYVQAPGGSYTPAGPTQVNELLNAIYSGDWTTPGVFHQFG